MQNSLVRNLGKKPAINGGIAARQRNNLPRHTQSVIEQCRLMTEDQRQIITLAQPSHEWCRAFRYWGAPVNLPQSLKDLDTLGVGKTNNLSLRIGCTQRAKHWNSQNRVTNSRDVDHENSLDRANQFALVHKNRLQII